MSPTLSRWLLYRSLRTMPLGLSPPLRDSPAREEGETCHTQQALAQQAVEIDFNRCGWRWHRPCMLLQVLTLWWGRKQAPQLRDPILWLRPYFCCFTSFILPRLFSVASGRNKCMYAYSSPVCFNKTQAQFGRRWHILKANVWLYNQLSNMPNSVVVVIYVHYSNRLIN